MADPATLDVREPQVLIHYPDDDDGFYWHHRVLLERVPGVGPGTWVCLTPDHELMVHSLPETQHLVLRRNSAFPRAQRPYVYAHDPVSAAELAGFRREAVAHAAILGDPGEDAGDIPDDIWVISEGDNERLGEEVEREAIEDPEQFQSLQDKGVLLTDGEVFYTRLIARSDLEDFKKRQKAAASDPRILEKRTNADGRPHRPFRESVEMLVEHDDKFWGHQGPRVFKEYCECVADTMSSFVTYHAEWIRRSGVAEGSSVAHSHRNMCEVLRLALEVDQVNGASLQCLEQMVRKLVQDEMAVERNPRAPDYTGLGCIVSTAVSGTGAVEARKFSEWVANRQRDQAQTKKQARLLREEKTWEGKGKGRKGKKGKGKGAEDGPSASPG